jgi:hypothetical protein
VPKTKKRNLNPPLSREAIRNFNARTRHKKDHIEVFHFERHGKKLRCVEVETMHRRAGEQL